MGDKSPKNKEKKKKKKKEKQKKGVTPVRTLTSTEPKK
jgi:hypothetical protein